MGVGTAEVGAETALHPRRRLLEAMEVAVKPTSPDHVAQMQRDRARIQVVVDRADKASAAEEAEGRVAGGEIAQRPARRLVQVQFKVWR